MEKQVDNNKFTWGIKNFSSLQSDYISSDQFVIGGCKWCLRAYPKGYKNPNYFSLYLRVADYESLPSGWKRHAKFSLNIAKKDSKELFQLLDTQHWFDQKNPSWGSHALLPFAQLYAKDKGYLMNGELVIVVELDVLEESEENINPVKKIKPNDGAVCSDLLNESIDINGFQVLPSQVESVNRLFERHPDIASSFRHQLLKTSYLNVLLTLIETLCQSPKELSKDNLADAHAAVGSLIHAGFKLSWLEKKLDEWSEKKEKEETAEIRIQKIEERLKDWKQRCSELEAHLEREKAEMLQLQFLYLTMILFDKFGLNCLVVCVVF